MVNTALDNFRKNKHERNNIELDVNIASHNSYEESYDSLSAKDLLKIIQKLPIGYRTVFNLFAIEGYSHEEIATMLNINAGTSKSNLHKARQKLKNMILKADSSAGGANYNNGMDCTPIVAIKAINMNGVFLNKGI